MLINCLKWQRPCAVEVSNKSECPKEKILLRWGQGAGWNRLRRMWNDDLSSAKKRKAPMKLTEAVTPTGNPQSIYPIVWY